jgi:ferrochelatase
VSAATGGDGSGRVGVVVMSHGTPATIEGLLPFYTEIRRGRPPSAEQLADLERRYRAIGGVSPLNDRTKEQVAGVGRALEVMAPGRFVVAGGAKFADPRIEDAVADLGRAGVGRAVGLVLAPHSSDVSVGEYARRARAIVGPNCVRMVAVSCQFSGNRMDFWPVTLMALSRCRRSEGSS